MKPKDHARMNIVAMREAQRQNRERKALEVNREDEKFKLKEFKDVPSQVKKNMVAESAKAREVREARANGDAPDAKFLRAHTREEREAEKPKPTKFERPEPKKKSNLPLEVLRPAQLPDRPQRNFQRENAAKIRGIRKEIASDSAKKVAVSKPANFGKVPKYLRERQDELKEEEREMRRLADIDVDCPPGMRLLPEGERQEMLRTLDQNRERVSNEIAKLPFVIDTVGLKKRKQAMENKIKEIDDAVRIFSRKKVYVEQ